MEDFKEYDKFQMRNIIGRIDHTYLNPNSTKREIVAVCEDAIKYGFYAVCVLPTQVRTAKSILKKTNIKVCTVVGFPLGENTARTKAYEAKEARFDGADEIDMVMCLSNVKRGEYKELEREIKAVKRMLTSDMKLKVIIQTNKLTETEIAKCCTSCSKAGADFVKSTTGFSGAEVTVESIKIMRAALVGTPTEIKASGGIKTLEDAIYMINAGATRLGTSHSVEIANSPLTKEYVIENPTITKENMQYNQSPDNAKDNKKTKKRLLSHRNGKREIIEIDVPAE